MKKKNKILVIGAGVSGLTTAISLREAGYDVVIVAEKFAPGLASNVAGALWEWPPAACGEHSTPRSLERSKVWCMTSYERFKALHETFDASATGIYLRNITFYFYEVLENLPEDFNKMNELAGKVDDFRRGLDIVPSSVDLKFQRGIKDAYRHLAPTVDTDVYMQWLFHQVKSLDCEMIEERISLNLIEHEHALLERFNCAAIVNCAALGSIEIANDTSMYPLRGALIRVKDEQGLIDGAHCIAHKETSSDEQSMIFIVPRGKKNTVILGGLVQMDQWGESMSVEDPLIRQMYDGCLNFLPELRALPLDKKEPIRVGLRPFTQANVCVESVPGTHLFYNYGHGGAGVTLSWGCAQEIIQRIQTRFQQEASETPFANTAIDNQKQTVFLLQDKLLVKFGLSFFHEHDCNIVLLCSREGLSKIAPAQFQHIDCVQLVECYDLSSLLSVFSQVKHHFKLAPEQCRIITNDKFSVHLASRMREALNLTGDKPDQIRPFVDQFELKKALNGSDVSMATEPETDQGTQYNTSVMVINGECVYFASCKNSRPNNEFLHGKPIGHIIVREQDPEYSLLVEFATKILRNLASGYPSHGVINLDVFVDNKTEKPILLSLSACSPGGLTSRIVDTYQGIALDEWHLKLQMGLLDKPTFKAKKDQEYSAGCFYPKREGIVTEIEKPIFNSATEITWHICPGQKLSKAENTSDIALNIFLSNNNWDELQRDFEAANSCCYFK